MLSLSPRFPCTRVVPARRQTAQRVLCRRSVVHARSLVVRAAVGPDTPSLSKLTDDLRLLETERDEAVRVGEDCARTAVKLEEMVRLLDQLALNKVQEGDDNGARKVLQEKLSTQDVLTRTSVRATTNFTLASKLAEKIGQQQAEIMDLLQQTSSSTSPSTSSNTSTSNRAAAKEAVGKEPQSSTGSMYSYSRPGKSFSSSSTSSNTSDRPSSTSRSSNSSSSSSSFGSDSGFSSGSGGYEAPWEKGLREARQRVAEAEAQATAAGSQAAGAGWDATFKARETIEEARERLRQQSFQSVAEARSRIKRSASESIAEARARINAEDAAALAEVHKVIDRYKSGGYVSEDELNWAFAQLERRSWRS